MFELILFITILFCSLDLLITKVPIPLNKDKYKTLNTKILIPYIIIYISYILLAIYFNWVVILVLISVNILEKLFITNKLVIKYIANIIHIIFSLLVIIFYFIPQILLLC